MARAARATDEKIDIPLLDLKTQFAAIREEIMEAIGRVCDSQWFVMGPEVTKLEQSVASYCNAEHGIGVSSGTDALLVALMALDIGPGDEVITTPYTFFATGGAVARLGARPVYCDIDPASYNLDPGSVGAFIESCCERRGSDLINKSTGGHVKAMIPVHLYGQMADMDPLMSLARENGLRVIEDAAQAIGSEDHDGRRAGSIGDIGCFSFFPSKNLGAFGDAGLCTANDAELAERLRVLRVHGGKPKYYHAVIGGNFRLDALQAAILSVKLKYLDEWTAGRQANADTYDRMFAASAAAGSVVVPKRLQGFRHIFNQYVIRVEQRDELRAFLTESGIGTEIYYPVSLHEQQCFSYLGYSGDAFPQSSLAARSTLALPIYPELTTEQQSYVVDRITEFCS